MSSKAPHPILWPRYNLRGPCVMLWIRRKFWAAR